MKDVVLRVLFYVVIPLALSAPAYASAAPALRAQMDHDTAVLAVSYGKEELLSSVKLSFGHAADAFDQTLARGALVRQDADRGATAEVSLVRGRATLRFQQRIQPLPEGLLVRYTIFLDELSEITDASIQADFTASPGFDPRMPPAEASTFELATRSRPIWVSVNPAATAAIEPAGNKHRLTITLAGPSEGESRISAALLISTNAPQFPMLIGVRPSAASVPQYRKFELVADLWAQFENPYDPDDISLAATFTSPTGKPYNVAGFLYQNYERSRIPDGEKQVEHLEVAGAPAWRIRFAPSEAGTWRYSVRLTTKLGSAGPVSGQFNCARSSIPGFVRVAADNPRYFAFTSGQPYFPIGHNVCWVTREGGTYEYEMYFDKMHAAGENYTRIWLCSWGMQLEGTKLDSYRLDDAWRLDRVFDSAQENGIYINFCLDNFHDWVTSDKRQFIPYFAENGGPIKSNQEFFTNPAAIRHYLWRIRYVISRWGYSTNLFAWELWNEMNYLIRESEPQYVIDWCRRVAGNIRRNDPYRHLITTSLGADAIWDKLWELNGLDIAQYHTYLSSQTWLAKDEEHDAVGFLTSRLGKLKTYGKPFLAAEWGFGGTNDYNPLNSRDRFGLHLHDAIWAASLSGAAGTVMPWWWDNYIEPNALYYHYRAFSRFADGIDWPRHQWKQLNTPAGPDMRVIGLTSDNLTVLWIQNPKNTWYNRLVAGEPAPVLNGKALALSPFTTGVHRVEWWDTYVGGAITSYEISVRDSKLQLRLPNCGPDVACKITRLGD